MFTSSVRQCLDLVLVLTLLCHVDCSSQHQQPQDDLSPREVNFHSLDFRNVVHWRPPNKNSKNLKYFVQHKVYGDKEWVDSANCQDVQQLKCDLSQETSDPREWYYARVRSSSSMGLLSWTTSPRFHPQWEARFSPPQIRPRVFGKVITVRLRPPKTPLQTQSGKQIRVTKLQKLTFRVYLMHNGIHEEVYETDSCSKEIEIQGLHPKTTYCLQAVSVTPRSGRRSVLSPSKCIRTA